MTSRKRPVIKPKSERNHEYDWIGSIPFLSVHAAALGVFFVSFSWWAVFLCVALIVVRTFGITGGYHRYFSHKAFKTSRAVQFGLAFLGNSSAQMGPLWWAAHHRHHHRSSDTAQDIHSPIQDGFFWSHMGWIISAKYMKTETHLIEDFARFPELRFLDRYHWFAPLCLAIAVFGLGHLCSIVWPSSQITSWQFLFWGFFLSTALLYHLTFSINSLMHLFGSRRFETADDSRNNPVLGVLTLGEGWHNNHHRYPQSARNGFYWWEFDPTYYVLKVMEKMKLVWSLQQVPDHVYQEAERKKLAA